MTTIVAQGGLDLATEPTGAMVELTEAEIDLIAGGWKPGSFFTGVAIIGGGMLAVASLPVTAPAGAAIGGAALVGVSGGYFVGRGLRD